MPTASRLIVAPTVSISLYKASAGSPFSESLCPQTSSYDISTEAFRQRIETLAGADVGDQCDSFRGRDPGATAFHKRQSSSDRHCFAHAATAGQHRIAANSHSTGH